MNKKVMIIVIALIVVLAGAGVAYNKLAPGAAGGGDATGDSVPVAGADADSADAASGNADAGSADSADADSADAAGGNADATETERQPAPDFTVYDAEGNKVSLSDFAGEPVVVNFWASWCPPCKAELPDFEKCYQEMGIQDGAGENAADGKANVRFLMVDLVDGQSETQESGSAFIEENGYTFPVYYDLDVDAAFVYGLTSIPVTIFVDADGKMAAYHIGQLNEDLLREGLGMIR